MTTTTIPILATAEAEARAAELGMRRDLEQMVEHVLRTAPGLHAIRVTLEYDPEYPDMDPRLVIWAHRDDPPEAEFDRTDWDWGGWQAAAFRPEVCSHFVMLSLYGEANGR